MKDKRKLILFVVLLAVLVGINIPWGSSSTAVAPSPVGQDSPNRPPALRSVLTIPDAVLEVEQLNPSTRVRPGKIQRNIFQYGPQPRPPRQQAQVQAQPVAVQPPPPPQAPVRFFGFAEGARGGRRQVFLTDGQEVYVATQGDVILQRYRLVRVGNENIEVHDLSGGHRWVVPLEQP